MKHFSLFFLLLLTSFVFSQINVGATDDPKMKPEPIKQSSLELLKKTKTLFIYRDGDEKQLEKFKSTISKSWTYTTLEFMSFNKFLKSNLKGNYSYFMLGGRQVTSSSGDYTYLYLTLWLKSGGEVLNFCRIELSSDFQTMVNAQKYIGKEDLKMMKYLYSDAILYNWNTFFIKNSLQHVNKKLIKNETRWLYKTDISHPDLSKVRSHTLYIPDYTLIKYKPFSGNEEQRHDIKKLMKRYPGDYKLVTVSQLNKIIQESSKPVYYLSYIKSSTDKYVNVIEGKTGEFVYSKYSPVSYNIKEKDIVRIASATKP